MLINIVLTFASRDSLAALGDTTSRERRLLELASELGNATLEAMCDWVIYEISQGREFRLKMVEEGEIELLLQGLPFD